MDIDAFTSIPVAFFRCIGLVPFHILQPNRPTPTIPWYRTGHLISSVLAVTSCIVGEVMMLVLVGRKPEFFIQSCAVCMYIAFQLMTYSKIFTIIWHRPQLSEILTDLSSLFPCTPSDRHEYRVDYYAHICRRLLRSYSIFQMLMVWFFNLFPLAEALIGLCRTGDWRIDLPFEIWYPVESYDRGWFEFLTCLQWFGSFSAVSSVIATDMLVCSILAQLCMHFDHLGWRLRRIRAQSGKRDVEEEGYAQLMSCVQTHYRLIRISETLDNVFDLLILLNIMSSVSLICTLLFLVNVSTNFTALVKFAMCLFTTVVQVLLISIFGDRFTESSLGIADAAWECLWYTGSPRFKRGIAILMHRAQRPQYLTAYKYTFVSMIMFTNVMSSSWQFFVLISSVYEN